MTDQSSNPLLSRHRSAVGTAAFVNVGDEQVPTEIYAYCSWLNSKERRHGVWVVIVIGKDSATERKTVEWRAATASDAWLEERGLIPKVGRAA